jgi:hypothetical protein
VALCEKAWLDNAGGTTNLSFDLAADFRRGEEIVVTLTRSLRATNGAGLDQS